MFSCSIQSRVPKHARKRRSAWKLTEYCPKRRKTKTETPSCNKKRKCCRGKNLKLNRVKKPRKKSILETLLTEKDCSEDSDGHSEVAVTVMDDSTVTLEAATSEPTSSQSSASSTIVSCKSDGNCWAHTNCELRDFSAEVRRFLRGSDIDPNMFRTICGQRFLECNVVKQLTSKLDEAGVLYDFYSLFSMLADGSFNPRNINFLMLMDTVRLFRSKSTSGMRYRPETKEFFEALYVQSRGSSVRTLGGPKHAGKVCQRIEKSGHLRGCTSQSNCAVPSRRHLRKKCTLASRVEPGLIEDSFKILDTDKKYFLAVDGKKVNRGLSGQSEGDIDLWGFEGPPTKKSNIDRLNRELQYIEEAKHDPSADRLREIVQMLSFRLKALRAKVAHWYKFRMEKVKQEGNNPDNKDKYQYAISQANTALYQLKSLIKDILDVNDDFCFCLAEYNSLLDSFTLSGDVDLAENPNCRFLLPPEQLSDHHDLQEDTHLVKQGTDLWKKLRKESFVTGSTMQKALMLGAAKGAKRDYNRHFREFVTKEEPPPFPPGVQVRLDHGLSHEKDALATLVGKVMPAFFPPCAIYLDVGPVFLKGSTVERLIEVSADGLITSTECSEACKDLEDKHIPYYAVEIKCPFPKEKSQVQVYYCIPYYYVCQVLSEMFAHSSEKLIFICYSEESTVVMEVKFDASLFERITQLCCEMYDYEEPCKLPIRPPECDQISADLKKFCMEKCTLLCEVRSAKGDVGSPEGDPVTSAYSFPKVSEHRVSADDLDVRIREALETAEKLARRSFQLLRKKASEMLMFMACNTDREHNESAPLHIPLAYALAPKGFRMEIARKMLERVKAECRKRNINIVGVSSDGQWGQFCFKSSLGEPLTKLQLVKETWSKVSNLGSKHLMPIIQDASVLPKSSLEDVANSEKISFQQVDTENCKVWIQRRNVIVECKTEEEMILHPSGWRPSYVKSLCISSKGGIFDRCGILNAFFTKPYFGGQLKNRPKKAAEVFDPQSSTFILKVLLELGKLNEAKWAHIGEEEFRNKYLSTLRDIRKLIIPELRIFHRILKAEHGIMLFQASFKKNDMVDSISRLLKVEINWKNQEVPSLKSQAKAVVQSCIPDVTLQCCVAKAMWVVEKEKWISRCPVPVQIPVSSEKTYSLYSYPEFNRKTKEVHMFVIDPTHVLTNLRSHATRKGFPGMADKDAFVRVCEKTPDVLSPAIVKEVVDKQNAEIAMRVFSEEVEEAMVKNGDVMTSEFIEKVRSWYSACDSRGILPDDRVQMLMDMQQYLLERSPVEKFPPNLLYCSGIPYQTFEFILNNVSQRIIWYHMYKEAFNNRAWSTLSVESYFSTVTSYTATGCPRASEVSKIIADTVKINSVKHNPAKSFYFEPAASRTYPVYLADESTNQPEDTVKSFFPVHEFDKKRVGKRRNKKSNITSGAGPLRGVRPIRSRFFKCDESTILPTVRLGITEEALKKVVEENS